MLRMANRHPIKNASVASVPGKLLLVEDNLDDLLNYSAVLRHHGYDVRSVTTYPEGVAWLDHELYDLVIVSQGGGSFRGRTVLAKALERDRHAPVLVLTGAADMPAYIEAMQMGAFDYLEKPLAPWDLLELVAKHVRPRESGAIAA
jgi:DNA-binding NtrC family response regulator